MPVITSIEQQQHDPERVSVFLDGRYAFGVTVLLVSVHRLSVGRELTPEDVETIRNDDSVERAHAAALNYLSYRPRSRREIEQYFRRRQVDGVIAASVIERLAGSGLVDDREFARFWVENRVTFRPRGTRALRLEMRQKGLDNEVIEDALSTLDDEEALAHQAAQSKVRSLAGLEEHEYCRRLVAFLQRRGFPYEVSARVARQSYTEGREN